MIYSNHTNNMNIQEYPVGMAYVPWQYFGDIYPLDYGFHRGTIFPELDLMFLCANPACGNRSRDIGYNCGCMKGGRV